MGKLGIKKSLIILSNVFGRWLLLCLEILKDLITKHVVKCEVMSCVKIINIYFILFFIISTNQFFILSTFNFDQFFPFSLAF